MDSIGKIVEEMRYWVDYVHRPYVEAVKEWVNRLEALTKEPVAEVIAHDTAADVWWQKPTYDLPIGTKLFAAPPTASTQDLDDFLSRVQSRVIELGHMPPAWPTNERDGTDDPVESAARMICGLLDTAAPAVSNAEFCPHCNPCRNGERIAKAESLNEEYDAVLRGLASYVGAGGYNSTGFIGSQTADDKIRWGIDHLVGVAECIKAEPAPDGLACPFCGDTDFDTVGLKIHLANWCDDYRSITEPKEQT